MATPMPPPPPIEGKTEDDYSAPGGVRSKRAHNSPPELDVTFCLDCTTSMGPYISSAQQNICAITEALVAYEKCDVRFGLVAYRDHPSKFLTKKFELTSSASKMRENIYELTTGSGVDEPEGLCCALYDALNMDWRKGSTKVVILVTDAPPHGLGEGGDLFPEGCPDGHDPIVTVRSMAGEGICLYTVACEPRLSTLHTYAKDFMVAIAEITGGQAVSLSSSKHLVDVILGSIQEEIGLEDLMGQFELDMKIAVASVGSARAAKSQNYSVENKKDPNFEAYEGELVTTLLDTMSKRGVKTKRLKHNAKIEARYAKTLTTVANLAEWRKTLPALKFPIQPKPTIPATRVSVAVGAITSEQVRRMAGKSVSRIANSKSTG